MLGIYLQRFKQSLEIGILAQFAKDHFDYVLIDEVHRAGARFLFKNHQLL